MRTGVEVGRYELYREWNTEFKHVLCASQRTDTGKGERDQFYEVEKKSGS